MPTTMEKLCRTCKFPFSFPTAEATFPCPACGAVNGRPQAKGTALTALRRATEQRLSCDFYQAEESYETVLRTSMEEHEAYWGLAQCRYGVEYIEDTRTHSRRPVVHGVRTKPMQADRNFLRACELAPAEVRAQYEKDAAYVDRAMAKICRLAEEGKRYDVFLCHKTSGPDGRGYSEDYHRASKLHDRLKTAGYSVFFAPLEDLLPGEDYEAGIYHALKTAKVMLLICSDAKNLQSVWVRSEWQRFLEMLDDGEDKHLITLMYGEMHEDSLPREIGPRHLQSVRVGELEAEKRLMEALARYTGRPAEKPAPAEKKSAGQKPKTTRTARQPAPTAKTGAETLQKDAAVQPAGTPTPAEKKPAGQKLKTTSTTGQPAPAPKTGEEAPQTDAAGQPARTEAAPATEAAAPVKPAGNWSPERFYKTKPVEGGCEITEYTGKERKVVVPPVIGGRQVVGIGRDAFSGRREYGRCVVLPEGVRYIDDWAFSCAHLTEVTFPASLRRIGTSAFYNCERLRGVTLPRDLVSIEDCAFEGCTGLSSIVLPRGLTSFDATAFDKCDKLQEILVAAGNPKYYMRDRILYSHDGTLVWCPASLQLKEFAVPPFVKAIGDYAFNRCSQLSSITLPDGLREIGNWAFGGCGKLKTVGLPKTLRKIGAAAFYECTGLQSIAIPSGITALEKNAFAHCEALKEVSLPDSLVRMEEFAFRDCCKLPEIVLPAGLEEIHPTAYAGCEQQMVNLTVSPKNKMLYVQDGVLFSRRGKLICCLMNRERYTVPEGVTEIGEYAFSGINRLVSIDMPERLTRLGECAFGRCTALTGIVIPEGLTEIEEMTFYECSSLRTVVMAESVKRIGAHAFSKCSSLRTLELPEGVTCVPEGAFSECSSLEHIGLPQCLERIETYAFSECSSLKRLALPEGLQEIGQWAFSDCHQLRGVKLPPRAAVNPQAFPARAIGWLTDVGLYMKAWYDRIGQADDEEEDE